MAKVISGFDLLALILPNCKTPVAAARLCESPILNRAFARHISAILNLHPAIP
jgi:hypothetical protein